VQPLKTFFNSPAPRSLQVAGAQMPLVPSRIQQQHAARRATIRASDRQIELTARHAGKGIRAVRQIERQPRRQRPIMDIERAEKLVADRRRCIRRTHGACPVSTTSRSVAAKSSAQARCVTARCVTDISLSAMLPSRPRAYRPSNAHSGIATDGMPSWTALSTVTCIALFHSGARKFVQSSRGRGQYALNSGQRMPSRKINDVEPVRTPVRCKSAYDSLSTSIRVGCRSHPPIPRTSPLSIT